MTTFAHGSDTFGWRFYPRYFTEVVVKLGRWIWLYLRLRRIYLGIKHDPDRFKYTDAAMEPVAEDETATREMFHTDAEQISQATANLVEYQA